MGRQGTWRAAVRTGGGGREAERLRQVTKTKGAVFVYPIRTPAHIIRPDAHYVCVKKSAHALNGRARNVRTDA